METSREALHDLRRISAEIAGLLDPVQSAISAGSDIDPARNPRVVAEESIRLRSRVHELEKALHGAIDEASDARKRADALERQLESERVSIQELRGAVHDINVRLVKEEASHRQEQSRATAIQEKHRAENRHLRAKLEVLEKTRAAELRAIPSLTSSGCRRDKPESPRLEASLARAHELERKVDDLEKKVAEERALRIEIAGMLDDLSASKTGVANALSCSPDHAQDHRISSELTFLRKRHEEAQRRLIEAERLRPRLLAAEAANLSLRETIRGLERDLAGHEDAKEAVRALKNEREALVDLVRLHVPGEAREVVGGVIRAVEEKGQQQAQSEKDAKIEELEVSRRSLEEELSHSRILLDASKRELREKEAMLKERSKLLSLLRKESSGLKSILHSFTSGGDISETDAAQLVGVRELEQTIDNYKDSVLSLEAALEEKNRALVVTQHQLEVLESMEGDRKSATLAIRNVGKLAEEKARLEEELRTTKERETETLLAAQKHWEDERISMKRIMERLESRLNSGELNPQTTKILRLKQGPRPPMELRIKKRRRNASPERIEEGEQNAPQLGELHVKDEAGFQEEVSLLSAPYVGKVVSSSSNLTCFLALVEGEARRMRKEIPKNSRGGQDED